MNRVLVTGGAGFIGSHLCQRLRAGGVEVTALDNFDPYYNPEVKRRNLRKLAGDPGFHLVEGDIRDGELVDGLLGSGKFDLIVHLAARAGVRTSLEDPRTYFDVNVTGTVVLLEAAHRHHVNRFLFGSSSSVYGNNEKVPFSEEDPVRFPVSPYAASKRAGELAAHTFHHLHGMDILCLRFFTVYGPRQRPEMAIHKFTRLIDEGRPVPRFGGGDSVRDYTYIDDIIEGIMGAARRGKGYRIYNLGESKTTLLSDLISLLGRALGRTPIIEESPFQPGDVSRTFADITRARKEIGYAPGIGMEEGIRRFIDWYRKESKE
ncbi:MAG: NAD-dependent epimerase/dehydratase family protein [Acidobacteriota bacterium]